MGRRRLPANGTQTKMKNVTNKMCVKTAINAQSKKLIARLKKLIAWRLWFLELCPITECSYKTTAKVWCCESVVMYLFPDCYAINWWQLCHSSARVGDGTLPHSRHRASETGDKSEQHSKCRDVIMKLREVDYTTWHLNQYIPPCHT